MSFRSRWSSSTSSRIASGSRSRCHRHSIRPTRSPSPSGAAARAALIALGGRTELVRRDVCDDRRLARGVRGMARRSTQISGRGHCMTSGRTCLGHGDLVACPGPREVDRATRSRVPRLSRLEEVEDMFRARRRPQCEEMVIRIRERPAAADRHEPSVAFFREDHPSTRSARSCLPAQRPQYSPFITKYEPRIVPASFDFCRANLNEPSSAGTSIPSESLNPTARFFGSSSWYRTLIDSPLS
jgi:hypothetical protein